MAAGAQVPSTIDAQSIRYESGGVTIEAYIARPKNSGKSPAVLIIHDDLGLNRTFREVTHRLAQAGFIALAPHLPSRKTTPAADSWEGSPERTPVAGLRW